jgi:GH43 family beta-xylosidase
MLIFICKRLLANAASTMFLNPAGPVAPASASSADPHVYKHTDGYYYYVHTSDNWDKVDLTQASSLSGIGIGTRKTIFTKSSRGCSGTSCYSKNIWAPEVYNIDGVWYVYFSAGGQDGHQRMWVISNSNADPMKGSWSTPIKINTPDTWSIDHTVGYINGQYYMAWSRICRQCSTYFNIKDEQPNDTYRYGNYNLRAYLLLGNYRC